MNSHRHVDTRAATNGGLSAGTLYTWWRGDPLTSIEPLPRLLMERALDLGLVCEVSGLGRGQAEARVREGNLPYIANLDGRPAAVGWSAHRRGHIGELDVVFDLPSGSRYLWDFHTLPNLRGQGIYPRLLQAILDLEAEAERFWIGHAPDNVASGKGILKAGFWTIGEVWIEDGGLFLAVSAEDERAEAAASLLQIPLLSGRQEAGEAR